MRLHHVFLYSTALVLQGMAHPQVPVLGEILGFTLTKCNDKLHAVCIYKKKGSHMRLCLGVVDTSAEAPALRESPLGDGNEFDFDSVDSSNGQVFIQII